MSKTIVHDTTVRIVCLGGVSFLPEQIRNMNGYDEKVIIFISIDIYWKADGVSR
jgi:hypothetical protein